MATHIGKKVKAVFDAQRPAITVTAFAREIGRSRKNVYELWDSPTIDTGVLRKIGRALNHDFFQDLQVPTATSAVAEPMAVYGQPSPAPRTPPLQITVNLDPADPDAAEKLERIMRILQGE